MLNKNILNFNGLPLIARTIIFPVGVLVETSYIDRSLVVIFSLIIFFAFKKNYVYPTLLSAVFLSILSVLF